MAQRKKIKIRPKGNQSTPNQKSTGGSMPFNYSSRSANPSNLESLKIFLKRHLKWVLITAGIFIFGIAFFFIFNNNDSSTTSVDTQVENSEVLPPSESLDIEEEEKDFLGFNLNEYDTEHHVFRRDRAIQIFFEKENIPNYKAEDLAKLALRKDVEIFKSGQDFYTLISKNNKEERPVYIYRISPTSHAIFKTSPETDVQIIDAPTKITQKTGSAIIKTNFWDAIRKNDFPHEIIAPLEEALKWSIDFYYLKPGDRFKVIYQEESVNGNVVGIPQIDVISFETGKEKILAFYVDKNVEASSFVDFYGRSLKKNFLKSPVKYGRISSSYDLERFHPVLKEKRPHYGTDYAAPLGTPIYSVAAGKISIASATKNNGNYIKIQHDKTYVTQYLHMSKFAKGIKKGVKVQQGEIIGYVGETGLASGPHVCFRFWKNGKQVDHLKDEIVTKSISNNSLDEEDYIELRDSLMEKLDLIEYDSGMDF